jgi:hypothetical protein
MVPGTAATDLGKAEDASHSSGDVGVEVLAVRNDTLATLAGTDGDYAPLQVNASGALFIQEGAAMDVSAATVTVDWAGTAPPIGAGTEAAALRVTVANNSTGVVTVDDGGGSFTVDNAGTFAVQVDGGALTALQLIDNPVAVLGTATYTEATTSGFIVGAVRNDTLATLADTDNEIAPFQVDANGALYVQPVGNVAHSGADAGNPLKIGGRAQDIIGAEPEEVSDNDRVDALFDMNGRIGVTAGSDYKYAAINDNTSGNNTIVAAGGAGKRIAVWAYQLVSDGTVDCRWEDGAGGTAFSGQMPFLVNGGISAPAGGLVPHFVGSANTLLNLELTAAVFVHGSVSYTVLDD